MCLSTCDEAQGRAACNDRGAHKLYHGYKCRILRMGSHACDDHYRNAKRGHSRDDHHLAHEEADQEASRAQHQEAKEEHPAGGPASWSVVTSRASPRRVASPPSVSRWIARASTAASTRRAAGFVPIDYYN